MRSTARRPSSAYGRRVDSLARVGEGQLEEAVMGLLRRQQGAWLTARDVAAKAMLGAPSAARALARLVERGLAEVDAEIPRGYRWVPFDVDLPMDFSVRRVEGKSWRARIETPHFYPDGGRIVLFVCRGSRVGDACGLHDRLLDNPSRADLVR
jgi:hypothetical protein